MIISFLSNFPVHTWHIKLKSGGRSLEALGKLAILLRHGNFVVALQQVFATSPQTCSSTLKGSGSTKKSLLTCGGVLTLYLRSPLSLPVSIKQVGSWAVWRGITVHCPILIVSTPEAHLCPSPSQKPLCQSLVWLLDTGQTSASFAPPKQPLFLLGHWTSFNIIPTMSSFSRACCPHFVYPLNIMGCLPSRGPWQFFICPHLSSLWFLVILFSCHVWRRSTCLSHWLGHVVFHFTQSISIISDF